MHIIQQLHAKITPDLSETSSTGTTTADCGCTDNVLANASFEDGNTSWTTSGSFSTKNTQYAVCGTYATVLNGAGSIYQQYAVAPGASVRFSAYGGYHVKNGQTFKISFYTSGNTLISTNSASVAVDWDVDTAPSTGPILKQYVLNATAPAGTAFARAEASGTGDYFKIDGACMQVTPPPADCNCDGNTLVNPSFETFTTVSGKQIPTGWSSSNDAGQIFTDDDAYAVCGTKNGLLGTSGGSFWQDVNVIPGSTAVLNIWGGYHVKQSHKFQLIYLNAAKVQIGAVAAEVALNKAVEDLPATGPNGMTKYTLTAAAAPAGTSYIRVLGSATGNYFKVDAACLKITPPVCETCTGNQLVNPSFEDGTNSWTKTGAGTFATSTDYVVCGIKSAKLSDKVVISQTKNIAPGNTVTWTIYAGYDGSNTNFIQTLKVKFFNGVNEITASTVTQVIDKAVTSTTVGLKKYTLTKQAPANTTSVVLEISSSAGIVYCDLGCFQIKTDTPLPVTLTDFSVKKEGTSASLSWKTTAETNSKSFEVQHSLNGKEWAALGSVDAQGESTVTKSYSYTHATPANGNNLYRLRMIDKDETFAYSRIVSENFVTDESALLYPNPSSNFMKLRNGNEKIASIQIYDIRGVKVKDFIPKDGVDVDISNLSSGSYIVTFKQSNGLIAKQKITVIR
ncbi:T9SS type A sorting domain-containing protein [Dyadobacter frigoris]|uniref:T9SS type A sorting domain-containing protein n=1 Tax=Dyadobacter frigoris TaxID=2576211 RepID=A0A4U6D6F9_9BACT|nr:T9SS type A sorting domain-containing protein [Dyadobacter frigoris]TKT91698.1 T9SS type A sorting domain-containing protein [Dyadobacter frigoris]